MITLFASISSLLSSALVALSKQKHTKTLKQPCTTTINELLRGISYRYPAAVHFDYTLKKRTEDWMLKAGLSLETLARIQPYIDSSVNIALTCYAHTSPQVQESVAIYTSYAITVDDIGYEFANDMKRLMPNFLDAQPIQNAILRGFWDITKDDFNSQFGQFAGDMIAKATLDFVCSCYLELERESNAHATTTNENQHQANAPEFAEYFRFKTGVSEQYAFFAFPEHLFREDELLHAYLPTIPYMMRYFNYANDIMSFYKESGADEKANYVSNQAAAHNISQFESLEILCKKTIEVFHTINTILSPNEGLRRNVQQWMHGYVVYHLSSARYRLDELDIPAVLEARQLLFPGIGHQPT